ncbi:hypothetical protein L7F22_061579 [Adiantum nelumboides]|nr:hypothetical protein [Adiantum nelumboides]
MLIQDILDRMVVKMVFLLKYCVAIQTFVAPSSQAEVFPLQHLQNASNSFQPTNKLGDGGYGSVYKGVLWDGREVALKRLHAKSHQGEREFFNEVNIITTVQHRNLIRLFGCCAEGSERILVYEYLKNKSLDKHLFECNDRQACLTWPQRYEIIIGIARGLAYLHEESRVCIVHRDIKPSNILLDENMVPKVADFGLARLCEQSHISTKIAGTIGYLAPEHAMTGRVTDKTDTYSFGLLALEVISGRRCWDAQHDEGLLHLSWGLHEGHGHVQELVDPQLRDNCIKEEVFRVMRVALLCLQEREEGRPRMSRVVTLLSERSYKFDLPIKPPWGVGKKEQLDLTLSSSIVLLPR